jgi:hypothetical protein
MDEESREWYRELKAYEYSQYKLDSRCCRQAKLGAINIEPREDPMLLGKEYKLCVNFCPECGKPLD